MRVSRYTLLVIASACAPLIASSAARATFTWVWNDAFTYAEQHDYGGPSNPLGVLAPEYSHWGGLDYVAPPSSLGTILTANGHWSIACSGAIVGDISEGQSIATAGDTVHEGDWEYDIKFSSEHAEDAGVQVGFAASLGGYIAYSFDGYRGGTYGQPFSIIGLFGGGGAASWTITLSGPANGGFGGTTGTDGTGGVSGGGDWDLGFGSTTVNSAGAVAPFGSLAAGTVTVPTGGRTAGTIAIDSSANYTFTGAAITLDSGSSDAAGLSIVGGGSHTISSNLNVATDLAATIGSGTSLTVTSAVSFSSGVSLSKAGPGILSLPKFTAPKLVLAGGTTKSTAAASNASRAGEFGMGRESSSSDAAVLDLTTAGAGFVVDEPSADDAARAIQLADGQNPEGWIRAAIRNGFTGGTWSGATSSSLPTITSAAATSNNQLGVGYATSDELLGSSGGTFLGETVDGSTVLMRVTYRGDANLDGDVNFTDLTILAQNYNGAGDWAHGDFDYDGDVDFDDQVKLAQNYSATPLLQTQIDQLAAVGGADFMRDLALAQSLVPEPTSIALLGGLTLLAVRRRS